MTQNKTSQKEPWDYLLNLPDRIKRSGLDTADLDKRAIWCQSIFYGGNTLRLWNEATELKIALLSACALKEGQRIILIGKYADESGIAQALRSLLGREGYMSVEEIGPQAVAAFQKIHSAPGTQLQWDFNYFDSLPDESLDRVILFGAASHIGNWKDCAQHIHRVLRDGGRVIIADAPWGGKDLITAAHMDTHLTAMLTTLLSGMGLKEEELPQIGPEDLTAIFKPLLRWSRAFSWRGLYLFYGQKGREEDSPYFEFPLSTEAVQAFLTEKPSTTPWDFLAAAEIDALGPEVGDINIQKKWGRMISFGGSLEWMHANSSIIVDLMYNNISASPGYRVLVIGERLESLGFLPELRKRIGKAGEIVAFDLNLKHFVLFGQLWEGVDVPLAGRHQWDYDFADTYPDDYFDLVWLPQGVHHARSWKEIAPKLLRALKPQGQVMMMECRLCHPVFFAALSMSGILKCIAEKLWWAMHVTFEEMPDYSTADLALAFGDSLTGTFSLEWNGWLLFWGYKK